MCQDGSFRQSADPNPSRIVSCVFPWVLKGSFKASTLLQGFRVSGCGALGSGCFVPGDCIGFRWGPLPRILLGVWEAARNSEVVEVVVAYVV